MGPEAALNTLREQNELARGWIRARATEKQAKAEAVANTLRPWLNNSTAVESSMWNFFSSGEPKIVVRPEARSAVIAAHAWIVSEHVFSADLNSRRLSLWDLGRLTDGLTLTNLSNHLQYPAWVDGPVEYSQIFIEDRSAAEAKHMTANWKLGTLYRDVARIAQELIQITQRIYVRAPESRISPPDYVRPVDPVLAPRFVDELDRQVRHCLDLERGIESGASASAVMKEWLDSDIIDFLNRRFNSAVTAEFSSLLSDVRWCLVGDQRYESDRIVGDGNPVFSDARAIARAYLSLARDYLEGVRLLMQDYTAASNPAPQTQIKIEGGNFPGAQIAMTIANIQSTITGVVQAGDPNMGNALKELTEAVLREQNLTAEEREDLLGQARYLAEAAQEPAAKRNHGVLKSVFHVLTQAAKSGTEIANVMNVWGDVLRQLLQHG